MRPARARLLALGVSLLLGTILVGLVTLPKAIAVRGSHRDYRASVVLRQQLGARLQALVDGLNGLEEQSRRLELRVTRIANIYALPPRPAGVALPVADGPSIGRPTIFARRIEQGNAIEARLRRRLDEIDATVAAISAHELSEPRLAATVPVRSPVRGEDVVLSSGFGPRRSPFTHELEFHAGLDFAAPRGTVVVAPADGVVAWAGVAVPNRRDDWWRLGRTVVLRHGDGYRTIFGHLDEIRARPGARVAGGEVIGTVGESGWTTAPHLHYEIRMRDENDWRAVDPRGYLLDAGDLGPAPPLGREGAGLEPPPLPTLFRR
ncbi:MAG: M23 family metallopeptidase [Thermoanaerobaculia bacterium]